MEEVRPLCGTERLIECLKAVHPGPTLTQYSLLYSVPGVSGLGYQDQDSHLCHVGIGSERSNALLRKRLIK
jgi:hypothetical protein